MKNNRFFALLSIAVILVFITSLVNTVNVFADDATPPALTEEPVVDAPPAEVPAAEEVPPVEETVPAVDEPLTVSEILEATPEDTDLIVLDNTGEALPLASADAAAVLAAPDPYFTVGGTTYRFFSNAGDCATGGFISNCFDGTSTPIQDAIDYLSTLDASPDADINGNRNIYVEGGIYTEDVIVDGLNWTTLPISLGIIGAGSGSTTLEGSFEIYGMNAFTLSGFSVADNGSGGGYVYAEGNTGTLTLNDLIVANVNGNGPTGDGIDILFHNGDVNLTYVDSSNNNNGGGAYIESFDNVTITNSHFDDNLLGGVGVYSLIGDVSLNTVTANDNMGGSGLMVNNSEDITIINVSANGNYDIGAILDNGCGCATGNIFISSSTFNLNGLGSASGSGLLAYSNDDITLANVTVRGNAGIGAELDNSSGNGDIALNGVTANENGYGGVLALTTGNVSVINSHFDSNTDGSGESIGLEVNANGNVTLNNVSASNNNGDGVDIHGYPTNFFEESEESNPAGTGLNVLVTNSIFNGNHSASPGWGYGLSLEDLGNAAVKCSQFTNNNYGIGAYGSGTLVTGGNFFSGNGSNIDNDPGIALVQTSTDCGGADNGRGFKAKNNLSPQIPVTGLCNNGDGEKKVTLKAGDDAFGLYENLCDVEFQLKEVFGDSLPGTLPSDVTLLTGLDAQVISDGIAQSELPPGGKITLKFPIPSGTDASTLVVLFWNGTAWVEVSGGEEVDGYYVVTVEKPGNYVLAVQ